MRLRTLGKNVEVRGKRVLLRIDANVPIVKGRAVDGPHGRVARAAVGIQWLMQRGAKVIVMTHLGSPGGRRIAAYSVKPIAKRLSSLLGVKVRLARSVIGKDVHQAVAAMTPGDVLLLENLRFDAREVSNAPSFAQELAKLADLYVNDAFAVSHRAHASIEAITGELPAYAGPLLENEVEVLGKLDARSRRPFVLVLGGFKMTTKLPIIEHFDSRLDRLVVGGALATAFLVAADKQVGKSPHEPEAVQRAQELIEEMGERLLLPVDVVVARSLRKDAKRRVVGVGEVGSVDRIVDIGPLSVKLFCAALERARTIVWNGPLGVCEVPTFCEGTRAVAKAIAARTGRATTIVGGGDTMPMVEALGLADKFTLFSTGGGALLQFLAGEPLPGVEALKV